MDQPLLDLSAVETFAEGLDHSEGICLTPQGEIYVGGEAGQIYKIAKGKVEHALTLPSKGLLLGIAADADGDLYVCDTVDACVWRVDIHRHSYEKYFEGTPERALRLPNWGAFDGLGNLYLSDSGGWKQDDGVIWKVSPHGDGTIWSTSVPHFPNGLALAEDGNGLFVVESTPGRLVYLPIESVGTSGSPTELAAWAAVPDGVAIARGGTVVITCYRPDAIYLWSEEEGLRLWAHDPEGTVLAAPTNAVFVGPGLTDIVFPNLGRWHASVIASRMQGVPLRYPVVPSRP